MSWVLNTFNNAGSSAADPVLANLGGELVFGAASRDIATVNAAYLNPTSGATTNDILASLSPAYTLITNTTAATYDDTTHRLTMTTTGLSTGDYLEIAHSSISGGATFLARITFKTTTYVLIARVSDGIDPFSGGGNRTLISVQVAWRYNVVMGSGFSASSGSGVINYFRQQVSDSASNQATLENVFYVRDAPTDGSYVRINGIDATGTNSIGNTTTPILVICPFEIQHTLDRMRPKSYGHNPASVCPIWQND